MVNLQLCIVVILIVCTVCSTFAWPWKTKKGQAPSRPPPAYPTGNGGPRRSSGGSDGFSWLNQQNAYLDGELRNRQQGNQRIAPPPRRPSPPKRDYEIVDRYQRNQKKHGVFRQGDNGPFPVELPPGFNFGNR